MSTHKVYSTWQRRREVPQIKMQGAWLEAAGLAVGSALRVRVEHGRLIIEAAESEASRVVAFPALRPNITAAAA